MYGVARTLSKHDYQSRDSYVDWSAATETVEGITV